MVFAQAIVMALIGLASVEPWPMPHDLQKAHPLLQLDLDTVQAAYDAGYRLHKKVSEDRLVGNFRHDMGKVRGGWTPSQAYIGTPQILAFVQGYMDAKKYVDATEGYKKFVQSYHLDAGIEWVGFIVEMRAWPGINEWDGSVNRSAVQSDVEDVTFVLRTQDGRIVHPLLDPSKSRSEAVAGVNSYTRTDSAGVWVDGFYTPITVRSYDVEGFTAYFATHMVLFRTTDKDGKPIATVDQPKVTLLIIRAHGELQSTFDLNEIRKVVERE